MNWDLPAIFLTTIHQKIKSPQSITINAQFYNKPCTFHCCFHSINLWSRKNTGQLPVSLRELGLFMGNITVLPAIVSEITITIISGCSHTQVWNTMCNAVVICDPEHMGGGGKYRCLSDGEGREQTGTNEVLPWCIAKTIHIGTEHHKWQGSGLFQHFPWVLTRMYSYIYSVFSSN